MNVFIELKVQIGTRARVVRLLRTTTAEAKLPAFFDREVAGALARCVQECATIPEPEALDYVRRCNGGHLWDKRSPNGPAVEEEQVPAELRQTLPNGNCPLHRRIGERA